MTEKHTHDKKLNEPLEPVTEPVEFIEPTTSPEPLDPAETEGPEKPLEPAEPSESGKMSEPATSAESTISEELEEPSEQAEPSEPEKSLEPAISAEPVNSSETALPELSAEPTERVDIPEPLDPANGPLAAGTEKTVITPSETSETDEPAADFETTIELEAPETISDTPEEHLLTETEPAEKRQAPGDATFWGRIKDKRPRRKRKNRPVKPVNELRWVQVRLIPIWLRLVILLVLLILAAIAGAMIGFSVIGDGSAGDVFKKETWQHIFDIMNGK